MDLGLTYRALAEGRVDLIAGDSTNGLIRALNLQILKDDRHYFPPYDAVPVFNAASLRRHPELVTVIESLAGRLSAPTMQQLNAAVDLEQRSPEQVIRQLVQVPLAGIETGLHLQHGGKGHQSPQANHQQQGGGAAEGRGGQRQGQHTGAYGGASD
jgi:hypothetical protein